MHVKDLISKLSKVNGDLEVIVDFSSFEDTDSVNFVASDEKYVVLAGDTDSIYSFNIVDSEAQFNGEAYFLGTDLSFDQITPKNGKDFSLRECYDIIGCDLIEVVHVYNLKTRKRYILICDEEGALYDNAELNIRATRFAGTEIYGNCILCPSSMLK